MKKKVLSVLFIIFIMVLVNSIHASVYAETDDLKNSTEIKPNYIAIVLCLNNLTLNSGGKLTCEGETGVQKEYIAGVKIELQQLSGNWTTIKTWEDTSDDEEMYLYKDWYVEKGSYRLKTTHTALDSSGDVIEIVTKYSETVDY
ncbi:MULTISPECIES: hypothetical protein [unclassified Sedimentibacter]|uniref:hypothetical protein n=1 Tax=unclassified Sedimentibacter TaxID=2649220 RepID=UPI0027E17832|nr:hypothetical protein [Sedimentibacter sp. MB35-C1]WMJ76526.1 hypothetical protein RBQ61_12925 [Sedimentibacter sp. MB35-C1]